jgi:hypothetical protein
MPESAKSQIPPSPGGIAVLAATAVALVRASALAATPLLPAPAAAPAAFSPEPGSA